MDITSLFYERAISAGASQQDAERAIFIYTCVRDGNPLGASVAKDAVLAEREACVKVANDPIYGPTGRAIAIAIQNRD